MNILILAFWGCANLPLCLSMNLTDNLQLRQVDDNMTTLTNPDTKALTTEVQVIDRRLESNGTLNLTKASSSPLSIQQYDPSFAFLVGPNPNHSLLVSTNTTNGFFHEASVYLPAHDELYITSNLLQSTSTSNSPTILISRIKLHRTTNSSTPNHIHQTDWSKMRPPPGIEMPNGGVNYLDGIIFCAQGTMAPGTGGIIYMPRNFRPIPLITNFHGRPFNSVNDVVVASDGAIWFTDPSYGFEQEIRPKPELPDVVYRFLPETGEVRVVADGFVKPNGIAFSPDGETLYVTDTGGISADGIRDVSKPASIYAFDVKLINGSPALINRRIFAMAAVGFPDGIKCDVYGNVYAGCGDGIEVWNPAGTMIGKILVDGGVANFSFGKDGEIFICNEQRLWRVQLAVETRGALLDGKKESKRDLVDRKR